jgi:Uma2 family endonuclease
MITIIAETGEFTVPEWVTDIDGFRRWRDEIDFPEEGRIWWLCGKVWADMSREQNFTHNGVRTEMTSVLHFLSKSEDRGRVLSDGLLLSNFAADISGNPDATFISWETMRSDRIRLIEGKDGGAVEVQGSPDMVMEIVSKSSEYKDTVELRQAYWEARIPEYWLVDVRKELRFDILRHTARGYVATKKQEGWIRSAVLGKSFRLTATMNKQGHPDYTLHVK